MTVEVPAFPKALQPSIDALVAAAQAGAETPPDPPFREVARWCEANQDESGLTSEEGFLVVQLDEALVAACDSDDEPQLDAGSIDGRVAALRKDIEALFRWEADTDGFPMAGAIRLKASSGKTAALCFYAYDGGYMGSPRLVWVGVYRSSSEFRAKIRDSGGLTSLTDLRRTSNAVLAHRCFGGSAPVNE